MLLRLIASRLVVSTLLLGFAIAIEARSPASFPVDPFACLIGLTYGLSIVYLATLRRAERSPVLVDLQLAIDAVMVSAFIHVTGGVTSDFSLLYVLPVMAASTVRSRRTALQVAGLGGTLYVGLVSAQYLEVGVLPAGWWLPASPALPDWRFAQYTVAINLAGTFGVALLSGSLAERLRSARAGLQDASYEIRDIRAFNDRVIDALLSGLITTDARGRIVSCNRAAARICGMAPDEFMRRDAQDALQLPAAPAALLSEGAAVNRLELQHTLPHGARVDIGLTIAPLTFPEGTHGFLLTFQDITNTKRLEAETRRQQRLAAVGEMAAGIAHELRNPLASMAGSFEILRQELALSDEQAQLMDIALRESDRLNQRIRLFLSYARPHVPARTQVDVGRLLNEAALLLRNSVDVCETHRIDVELPRGTAFFHGDESDVRQVLWNLGTHGLRSMPDGGRLLLSAWPEGFADEGGQLVIAVQDQGAGIRDEQLDHLFEPFRSGPGGAGLGLPIVHRIVSEHGGVVSVSSIPGAGTNVIVRLPLVPPKGASQELVVPGERRSA